MDFSSKLIAARKKAGLSQKKLAMISQISLRSIQYYENNGKKPRSLEMYRLLAEALGIQADDLLDDYDRFQIKVEKMYGHRGVWQLRQLLENYKKRFADGIITQVQFDFFMANYQELFILAKQKKRKHVKLECRKLKPSRVTGPADLGDTDTREDTDEAG